MVFIDFAFCFLKNERIDVSECKGTNYILKIFKINQSLGYNYIND